MSDATDHAPAPLGGTWALHLSRWPDMPVLIVLEVPASAQPAVHLALRLIPGASASRALERQGWRALGAWQPRSWGAAVPVDVQGGA